MDLDNHRKHSFSCEVVGNSSCNVQMLESGPFHMDKWNQEKLPEVKDAENIASDLFRIGACILGRQQKWL